ncbi:MAG: type I phosphomannose isomerase catalytic subunit [Longimicrobiales bacterium]
MARDTLKAPLLFAPRFQDYVWGGRNLARVLGRDIPDGIVAESWEISAHPAAPTIVNDGPLLGASLPELVDEFGVELVGSKGQWAVDRGAFPLLIKLLDANQPLSVQVHPDDAYADEHEDGELGKTEMWYVLDAAPGAEIVYGLRSGVTPGEFQAAVSDGRVEECLHRVQVKAGDAVLIEAGTVHAILEGIVLAEIQQSSNTTYRVYDWGRVGNDGKPRALHIEEAMNVIDFQDWEPSVTTPEVLTEQEGVKRELVSSCDKFVVERITVEAGRSFRGDLTGETFEVWGVLEGSGAMEAGESRTALDAVRFALLPATMGSFEFSSTAGLVALRAYLP